MVVCKYYQQGYCKFGNYCRFDHPSAAFGGNQSQKPYDGKSISLSVAEEILAAERGGQWPLSCFGPFKEQPCIPGMEDISPEEVRWEMYQAQKNGAVEQTKAQFQQFCEEAKAIREVLKNPTHETAALLEKLQKGNRESGFGTKSNFPFSSNLGNNNASGGNVFGSKTFGTTNSFMGGFNSAGNTSLFGKSSTTNSTVFGGKPSFSGQTSVFGGQTATSSIFGNTAKPANSIFGGGQNMPTFGTAAQSTPFSMGNTNNSGSMFSQSNNIFSSQAQSTSQSVFGSNTTTATSPFSTSTQQTNSSPFGITSQPNMFGNTAIQPTNSMFGGAAAPGNSSILRQPKTTIAFGGAPVFNSTPIFGSGAASGSTFGAGQTAFNTSRNIFGTSTSNTTFGSNVQPVNSFNGLSTAQNIFTSSQNTNSPFGTTTSSSASAFGANSTNVFASSASSTPFSQASSFGEPNNAVSNAFGTTTNTFLNTNQQQPTESASIFASTGANNPFASTTSTSTMSNPFASHAAVCTGTSSSQGFGWLNVSCKVSEKIDESIYSTENQLTDDEKQMYLSDQFILGKIPIKPPTIELR